MNWKIFCISALPVGLVPVQLAPIPKQDQYRNNQKIVVMNAGMSLME
jgi:hypothetical protein